MENKINALVEKFHRKTNTHPELSHLWILYLSEKKKQMEDLLIQGENTLEMLETTNDISLNNIIILLLVLRRRYH